MSDEILPTRPILVRKLDGIGRLLEDADFRKRMGGGRTGAVGVGVYAGAVVGAGGGDVSGGFEDLSIVAFKGDGKTRVDFEDGSESIDLGRV